MPIARIIAATIALLLSILSSEPGLACPRLQGATLSPIKMSLASRGDNRRHLVVISGILSRRNVPEQRLRTIGPAVLCASAVGGVTLNGWEICAAFDRPFDGRDRLQRAGPNLGFEIRGEAQGPVADRIQLVASPSAERCAPAATFSIRAGEGQSVASASILADRLEPRRLDWTERQWGPGAHLDVSVTVEAQNGGSHDRNAEQFAGVPPPSWSSLGGSDIGGALMQFLWAPAFSLLVLGAFTMFGGALLYAEAEPPLRALVKALTASVVLYVGARWVSGSLDLARLLQNASIAQDGWAGRLWPIVSMGFEGESGRIAAALILLLPLTMLLWAASWFAGEPVPGPDLFRHFQRQALRSLAHASLLAVAFLAVAAVAMRVLPASTFFEPVALVASFGIAWWAMSAFAPVTDFGRLKTLLASVIFTFLFLYPQPVLTSSAGPPTAVENAMVWFSFVGGYFVPTAMLLTVVLSAALKIAGSRRRQSVDFDRTILFLFGFSIALGAIGSLTPAILLFAVLLAAERLLFPKSASLSAQQRRAAAAATVLPRRRIRPTRLAFIVAVVAAAVFWLQYAGDLSPQGTGPTGMLVPAMLIYAAAVPAATGGLLLQYSYNRLPGPIASAKALLICAFAFSVAVAVRLPFILAERSLLPAIIDILGVFAALLAVGIFLYDGPQARKSLGGETLKQRLAGSGFGWLLTILSTVSLATVSALSPIFFDEIGSVFRNVVSKTIHTQATQPAQAGSGPSEEEP